MLLSVTGRRDRYFLIGCCLSLLVSVVFPLRRDHLPVASLLPGSSFSFAQLSEKRLIPFGNPRQLTLSILGTDGHQAMTQSE